MDNGHQFLDFQRPTKDDSQSVGIAGVIVARNEELNIVRCLEALQPHVSEIILIDMESSDRTVELARPFVSKVLRHPLIPVMDIARHAALSETEYDWFWFVDADECVPGATGEIVNKLIRERGHEFEAISIPFKSYFCGQWMRHCGWWPGYTCPRVLKRGFFEFSRTLHGGVKLSGREVRLPPDPQIGIDHYSYRDLSHYLEKLNRYTSTEASQLAERSITYDWRAALQSMVHDLWKHYELHDASLDGERGWILTWLSGQYRWLSHAKLIDCHPPDTKSAIQLSVPRDLDEVLSVMTDHLAVLRRGSPELPLGIVWRSPIWDPSGYADECRTILKSLARGQRVLRVESIQWNSQVVELAEAESALLRSLTFVERPRYFAAITDCIPTASVPDPRASLNILRTTFETDRIPSCWLSAIEQFDEVWVPSWHNFSTFRRTGVPPEKLRVVPSCIDTERFRPDGCKIELPHNLQNRFVFLSVFDWSFRKGWNLLIRAYCQSFGPDDSTGLLLKITRNHKHALSFIFEQIEALLQGLGQSLRGRPDIAVVDEVLNADSMAALYRSVHAFALPSRGEGWGRPYMEAMASGLPTIGTRATGNVDFMNDLNSFLVDATESNVPEEAVNEIPSYRGHRWHEPNFEQLKSALRTVFENGMLRESRANRAISDIGSQCGLPQGSRVIEMALTSAERRFKKSEVRTVFPHQIRVVLEGEFFACHSLSGVNEQLAIELQSKEEIALSLKRVRYSPTFDEKSYHRHKVRPYLERPFEFGPQITIRHTFPPNWLPPESGKWVHIQPWEFGHLPIDWIEPLRDQVDEIWAYSRYVRDVYEASGIPSHKIQVIPLGIDPVVFNPEAPPLILPTSKSFAFLFVGGVIARKGADIVVQAYLDEFSRNDDVCLVVKDLGSQTFYRDSPYREQLIRAAVDPSHPQIIYLNEMLTDGQMASLYTAADCLVAPYRGEGFGLPILEAMACARAPIVPAGGPSDDFVTEKTGFVLPAKTVECSHPWRLVGPALELKVDVSDVRRAMRSAFEDRTMLVEKGRMASRQVLSTFTWCKTVDRMTERIKALAPQRGTTSAGSKYNGTSSQPKPITNRSNSSICAFVVVNGDVNKLGNCLAHFAPFVDELIVVSDGMDDRCSAIAKEYGAKVYDQEWNSPAISVRNRALQNLTSEWVLVVNPAETLAENELIKIKQRVSELAPNVLAVSLSVPRRPNLAHGYASQLRIFRQKCGLEFDLNYCDGFLPRVKFEQFQVLDIPFAIHES